MSVKSKNLFNKIGITFTIILGVWISPVISPAQGSQDEVASQLGQSILSMGYDDFSIDECWVELGSNYEPTEANGWNNRSITRINISQLQDIDKVKVFEHPEQDYSFYILEFTFKRSLPYERRIHPSRSQLSSFRLLIESLYPGANWPYVSNSPQADKIPIINSHLLQFFPELEKYSREEFIIKNETHVWLRHVIQTTSIYENHTEDFRKFLSNYSKLKGC